jgi:hypothetical protein
MHKKQLPVTCPLCGRKSEYSLETLVEGSILTCQFCKLQLKLHGHMWDDIQTEIAKVREK